MTPFDRAVLAYLETLPRGARAYAAHYAHHVAAGSVNAYRDSLITWDCRARDRAKIRKAIDALRQADDDAIEAEVTRAEEAIEAGQLRWSETGSTRR